MEQAYEIDAGERRHRRRLDDHRAANSDRGDDVVDNQVQRVIERRVMPRCRSSAAAILAHEQRSSPFRSSALCRKCWRGQSPDILAVRLAQQLRIFWDKLTKPFIVLLRIIWH
jgi:hypothetical protein